MSAHMYTSMNVHHATEIAVRSQYIDGVSQFWVTVFTVKTEGGQFSLSVMSAEPLAIEGASQVNAVASPEAEPA